MSLKKKNDNQYQLKEDEDLPLLNPDRVQLLPSVIVKINNAPLEIAFYAVHNFWLGSILFPILYLEPIMEHMTATGFKVTQLFIDAWNNNFSNWCFKNHQNLEETSICDNHYHCAYIKQFSKLNTIKQFIESVNNVQVNFVSKFLSFSNLSDTCEKTKLLKRKIKNVFWLENDKLFGNIVLTTGKHMISLITTVLDDADILVNITPTYQKYIAKCEIINSYVYVDVLCNIEVKELFIFGVVDLMRHQIKRFNEKKTVLRNVYIGLIPHKLVSYEIIEFKNSNWPVRAITDLMISSFENLQGFETELHWSFFNPTIRKLYLQVSSQLNDQLDKLTFIKYIKENPNVCFENADKIISDLTHNRVFWFIVPTNNLHTEISAILRNLKNFRTLPYKYHEFNNSEFSLIENEKDVLSTSGFFKSTVIGLGNVSFLLLKPNFFSYNNLKLFNEMIAQHIQIVSMKVFRELPDDLFNCLYDSCLTRPYGPAWKEYLQSDVSAALLVITPNVLCLREIIKKFRDATRLTWIKNAIHCSANNFEVKRDLNNFFKSFLVNDVIEESEYDTLFTQSADLFVDVISKKIKNYHINNVCGVNTAYGPMLIQRNQIINEKNNLNILATDKQSLKRKANNKQSKASANKKINLA